MSRVDDYIAESTWPDELAQLRRIVKATGLSETVKWGMPCYMHKRSNIISLTSFQRYFGLWFHQGALLKDDANVLINAQEGKTKALRQWRMKSGQDIQPAVIKRYIEESVEHAKAGNAIKPRRKSAVDVPEELSLALRAQRATKAFAALTPGVQREYARYVAEAKRSDTKARRIEKILPMIKAGSGLNDRYRR